MYFFMLTGHWVKKENMEEGTRIQLPSRQVLQCSAAEPWSCLSCLAGSRALIASGPALAKEGSGKLCWERPFLI